MMVAHGVRVVTGAWGHVAESHEGVCVKHWDGPGEEYGPCSEC